MSTETLKLFWSSPGDMLAITNGSRRPGTRLIPDGMRTLADTPLERQVNAMMLLHDEAGLLVGTGTELEVVPLPGTDDPLEVYFTISLKDRGAIFIHEQKRYLYPELTALVREVRSSGTSWTGELPVVSTCGPAPDGRAQIIAGTGEFEGVTGTMFQTMTYREVGPAGLVSCDVTETLFLTTDGRH